MDRTQLVAILLQGHNFLLLLLFTQLLLPLEPGLLGIELLEAQLVVLLLLLILEIFYDILRHIVLGVIRIIVIRHLPIFGEALVDLGSKVEGAIAAPWPALQVLEPVNVLDFGEVLIRLGALRFHLIRILIS